MCPEPTCVHHDPARALGDLTGIKKHYSRKHGEKKFKCEKCSKRYAVQSDWKAHSKTCGTREYRCDCGTLFSRRDSFITHRAFCDALAQESARHPAASFTTLGTQLFGAAGAGPGGVNVGLSQMANHQLLPSLPDHHSQTTTAATDILDLGGSQFNHLLGTSPFRPHQQPNNNNFYYSDNQSGGRGLGFVNNDNSIHRDQAQPQAYNTGGGGIGFANNNNNVHRDQAQPQAHNTGGGGVFSNKLFPGGKQVNQLPLNIQGSFFPNNQDNDYNNHSIALFGGPEMGSVYNTGLDQLGSPCMSATALLQKAAQMGSTTSRAASLLNDTVPASLSPKTFRSLHGDQNDQNNLHDLINSFSASNGRAWVGPTRDGQQQQQQRKGGSSDGMTRDFLGVGGVMQSMSGGFNCLQTKHQQQQPGIRNANNPASATNSQALWGSGNSFH